LCLPLFVVPGLLQLVSPAVAVDHPGVARHAVEALAALAQDSRSMKGLVSNMLYIETAKEACCLGCFAALRARLHGFQNCSQQTCARLVLVPSMWCGGVTIAQMHINA
jgi:hypothetical protein